MVSIAKTVCRGAWLALALAFPGIAANATETVNGLYQAKVHVTGQEEPNRSRGFAAGLEDVLVKLSGDPRLIGDPAVAALGANAGSLVRGFGYRDLMAGIPVHDEQGTRQRPFILTFDFDPQKIDAALKSLGREPWTADRPRVVAFVGIDYGTTHYLLANDGARGRDQREALVDAAWRFGIPLALPSEAAVAAAGLSFESLPAVDLGGLQAGVKSVGGDLAIAGTLTWTPKVVGWTASWRFAAAGKTYQWSVNGVSFDEAFRSAMLGAAQILSGHDAPKQAAGTNVRKPPRGNHF